MGQGRVSPEQVKNEGGIKNECLSPYPSSSSKWSAAGGMGWGRKGAPHATLRGGVTGEKSLNFSSRSPKVSQLQSSGQLFLARLSVSPAWLGGGRILNLALGAGAPPTLPVRAGRGAWGLTGAAGSALRGRVGTLAGESRLRPLNWGVRVGPKRRFLPFSMSFPVLIRWWSKQGRGAAASRRRRRRRAEAGAENFASPGTRARPQRRPLPPRGPPASGGRAASAEPPAGPPAPPGPRGCRSIAGKVSQPGSQCGH